MQFMDFITQKVEPIVKDVLGEEAANWRVCLDVQDDRLILARIDKDRRHHAIDLMSRKMMDDNLLTLLRFRLAMIAGYLGVADHPKCPKCGKSHGYADYAHDDRCDPSWRWWWAKCPRDA